MEDYLSDHHCALLGFGQELRNYFQELLHYEGRVPTLQDVLAEFQLEEPGRNFTEDDYLSVLCGTYHHLRNYD